MDYLKGLLRNLTIIFGLGLILYIAAPGIVGLVFQTMGGLYGLLLIPMLLVAALPDRKKKKSYANVNRRQDNVAGVSTHKMADKRYRDLIIYGFILFGLCTLMLAMVNNSKALGIGGAGLLVLLLFLKFIPDLFLRRINKKGKEVTRARRGTYAEERVDDLFAGLSDQYFIINDVVSKIGNIDHVIIKKDAGIFLIETKSHHGKISVQEKTIYLNGHLPEKDFISQTLNNAYWLRDRLKLIFEPDVWIFPFIVFTNAFVPLTAPVKGIHIVNVKFLISTIEKIKNTNSINEQLWEKREIIFKLLKSS